MSTIGFGFTTESDGGSTRDALDSLAMSFGYLVSFEPNLADDESREGISMLAESFSLTTILLLHSPPRPDVPLAADLYLEMRSQKAASFFTFLHEIHSLLERNVEQFTVFFAEEWYRETSVRRLEGSLEDLIGMLKRAGGWHLELYNFGRRTWWEFDEFPLVFTVKTKDSDRST